MESQTNQEWTNVVRKDIQELDAKHKLSKLNAKYAAKKYKIIPILFILLSIGLIIYGFIPRHGFEATIKTKPFFVAGSILLPVTLIVWGAVYSKFFKARKKILAELNLKSYYASALTEISDNTYSLSSLKKDFDLPPQNFVPNAGQNRTDNVLNITSKEGKRTKLSFGTITNKVVRNNGKDKDETYTRYRYLTINLLAASDLVATIQKSVSFLKIFKTKDNTDLESTEFEKIFAVVANDQILIRKLLTPKVLANLVDKANSEDEIPAIEFNKQNITICWPSFLVSSWTDPRGVIAEPRFFGKNKDLADTLCQKIADDINLFLDCLTWFDTYEVS